MALLQTSLMTMVGVWFQAIAQKVLLTFDASFYKDFKKKWDFDIHQGDMETVFVFF